ncbi:MAG: glycosyltransferase [Planctomycetes bacterium]|nr:glycosyltransferase [Planctomycetota bacterium]
MQALQLATGVGVLGLLALLTAVGLHRAQLLALLALFRRRRSPASAALPFVTVQLPVYNEATVAVACVEAVARFDYPRDRFEVQVLDDSSDETRDLLDRAAETLRTEGLDVRVVRRPSRTGYKAGALAHGLTLARGELMAIFDADFVPPPDFLGRAVAHFGHPSVGLVQARWDHANRGRSLLTRVQALLLDGHFLVEQEARHRSGRPFNFNGTAGVLRRSAIEAAGGWASDTLTEDLDLSIRAQLVGWRFVFMDDLAAPGELPADMAAFRSQQRRWVQGSAQTARKLLARVWSAPGVSLATRVEATAHLLLNGAYVLALCLALLAVPAVLAGALERLPLLRAASGWVFWGSTLGVGAFLLVGQARRGAREALEGLALVPLAFALCLGLSLSNGLAYLTGLFRPGGEFVRTPKQGAAPTRRYTARRSGAETALELALAAYCGLGAAWDLTRGQGAAAPLLVLFALGFLWVGGRSVLDGARPARP